MSPAKQPRAKRAARPMREVVDEAHDRAKVVAQRAAGKAAKRGKAREREQFFQEMHGPIDHAALGAALAHVAAAGPAPMAFPGQNAHKWVPIGPTVTRRGQAMSRPRMSGRIRDLAVSDDGTRAYVLSAKGGVWYTGDGGATWGPVGGWAGRSVNPQGNGNMFSGGALLVHFAGNLPATDVVLVGTGEPVPWQTETGSSAQGGIGVLAGLGPATGAIDGDPWEADTGGALMNGTGVRRLVRRPGSSPLSKAVADQDRVMAATTTGLFLGTRQSLPAVPGAPPAAPGQPRQPALPVRDGYAWVARPAAQGVDVTDVIWFANGAGTRLVYAVNGAGLFFSDDDGQTATAIAGSAFAGRTTLARVPGTTRVYALGETASGGPPPASNAWVFTPAMFQVPDVLAAAPVVLPVGGVPPDLFGGPGANTQGGYDQALAVEHVGGNDRIYFGGSWVMPRSDAEGQPSAALFCFETPAPANPVTNLAPVLTVSKKGNPPTGSGGDREGLIGNNVHADVHVIRLTGPAAPGRHVWVGCDGGVYVSQHDGRVNTFAARNNGLATLEPIFLGTHPTSSHFLLAGFQDNGSQVRIGDTVWEATFLGDGGGSAIHPIRSDIHVTQYVRGRWNGAPASSYIDPLTRTPGNANLGGTEENTAAWASGVATIADTATTGRLALGTTRVWLTDHLGDGTGTRWRVLPYPSGTQRDPRPGGVNQQPAFGVPGFVNASFTDANGNSTADQVIDLVWQSPTVLLVLHRGAIVRYTNTDKNAGTWTSRTWLLTDPLVPLPTNAVMTCVATVPGGVDFYVGILGDSSNPAAETLWYWDEAGNRFLTTGFRTALDDPGPPAVVTGPRDPVFSVAVDPLLATQVYVGSATGVWTTRRQLPAGTWPAFVQYMNGLPQATVQDLRFWHDPAVPAGPRLLRAGVQSRGIWEVDVTQADPRRTYVRVHPRDDRRVLPTPMANPRLRPGAPPEPVFASPDVVVRPQWPRATAPAFHSVIQSGNVKTYDLWTFQTALRWLYPSCVADGQWSDAMRDLVRFHRAVLGLSPGAFIDADLWHRVVGPNGIRLREDPNNAHLATVTTDPADPLAVYRAPWQTVTSFDGAGTEIDLLETVLPTRSTGDEWVVFREPSTVDVLLHHRDSRPVMPGAAFAVLLWRPAPTAAALLGTNWADIPPYLAAAIAAPLNSPPAAPLNWQVATSGAGAAMRTLPYLLDARMPRAVSIDVDLSAVPTGHRVMFLALVGSLADDPLPVPVGPPTTLTELVRGWPAAAMRIVKVTNRA